VARSSKSGGSGGRGRPGIGGGQPGDRLGSISLLGRGGGAADELARQSPTR
jgi:hypothetical protein